MGLKRSVLLCLLFGSVIGCTESGKIPADSKYYVNQAIFPYQQQHTHGSTITELPNGDLMVAWFQGSGERDRDDPKIMGARKKKGSTSWSTPFEMVDTKGFADVNPVLFIDSKGRLQLHWYTIMAYLWETALLKYVISDDYLEYDGGPKWTWQEVLHVKHVDDIGGGVCEDDPFVAEVQHQMVSYGRYLDSTLNEQILHSAEYQERLQDVIYLSKGRNMTWRGYCTDEHGNRENVGDIGYPYFRRLGWQTRSRPFITGKGRIILPLYADGFIGMSLMAISDDDGGTWHFSNPIVARSNKQPTIAEGKNGELIAYMRNCHYPYKINVTRSTDQGESWSTVTNADLPNPCSACELLSLDDGSWLLLYNDSETSRHRLVGAISDDQGSTWKWKKALEIGEAQGNDSDYPAAVLGADGTIHITYSHEKAGKKTIRYAAFRKEYIMK
jgi:predicted neuraminidase